MEIQPVQGMSESTHITNSNFKKHIDIPGSSKQDSILDDNFSTNQTCVYSLLRINTYQEK